MLARSYQYAVVQKYVDNLIAWGDQLFRRDTIESINEATQLYVLAAKILGKRPESSPGSTTVGQLMLANLMISWRSWLCCPRRWRSLVQETDPADSRWPPFMTVFRSPLPHLGGTEPRRQVRPGAGDSAP